MLASFPFDSKLAIAFFAGDCCNRQTHEWQRDLQSKSERGGKNVLRERDRDRERQRQR